MEIYLYGAGNSFDLYVPKYGCVFRVEPNPDKNNPHPVISYIPCNLDETVVRGGFGGKTLCGKLADSELYSDEEKQIIRWSVLKKIAHQRRLARKAKAKERAETAEA